MTAESVVDDAPSERVVFLGDRWMRDVNLIISHEVFGRIRAGYQCLNCREILNEPFPESCPLVGCGYGIRENQLRDLERDYQGENEEFNRLMSDEEPVEGRAARSGIWVPGAS